MRLQVKLTMYILLLTSIVLLTISGIGYWNANKQLVEDLDFKMGAIADQRVQQLDAWLLNKTKTIEDIAFIINSKSNKEVPDYYFKLDKKDSSISDIYFGFSADGRFIHGEGSPMPPNYDPRKRGWYTAAVQRNGVGFSDPYIDTTTKKYCVSPSLPIKDEQGNIIGVIAEDILLETLSDMIKKDTLDGKGYAFIMDAHGVVLAHPDEKLLSTNLAENPQLKDIAQQMLNGGAGKVQYTLNDEKKITVFRKIPSTGWILAFTVLQDDVYSPLIGLRNTYIGVDLFVLVIMACCTVLLARKMVAPILDLTDNARKMADGDLTVKTSVKGNDEIAVLSQSFNQMGNNLHNLIQEVKNLTAYLVSAATDMRHTSEEAGQVSEQIATTITEMAQDSTEQADIIQNSASMVRGMTKSINIITQNVTSANGAADKVREAVDLGREAVIRQAGIMEDNHRATDSVNSAIEELFDKSKQIGQIVEVITGIAGQTNLLALNAAIEAARAGENGRGFAVVADEVRKLSEQAGSSSQEIAKLIQEIQEKTEEAVKEISVSKVKVDELAVSADVSKSSFEEINQSINDFISRIQQIAIETQQANGNAEEVSRSISKVAGVSESSAASTEQVAAATEEQTAAVQSIAHEAQSILEQANALNQMIARFKI
ncbi:MAG: methyl-accepting chemotaxis sensory transducer with Cache sensor [Firmicutes bacterium]|nr:methyl-accepting chemotaxis sensory transducer with Cache sensor [Bacillota bacterium]